MSAGVLAGRRSALACSAGEARIRRPQPERKSGIGADPARARQQLAKGRAQVWRGASEALSKSVTSKNPTLSKAPLDLLGETKLLNLRHLQIGPTERNTAVFLSPLFSTTFNATLVVDALSQRALVTSTMGVFSVVTLVLAFLGIYGVVSYSVANRRTEVALRMALGADKCTICRSLVLRGMRPVVAGLLIGLIATWSLSDVISGLLYGESLRGWPVYALVSGCTLAVSLLAIAIPALRAASMDPIAEIRKA